MEGSHRVESHSIKRSSRQRVPEYRWMEVEEPASPAKRQNTSPESHYHCWHLPGSRNKIYDLPVPIAEYKAKNIPWGHKQSGSIYTSSKKEVKVSRNRSFDAFRDDDSSVPQSRGDDLQGLPGSWVNLQPQSLQPNTILTPNSSQPSPLSHTPLHTVPMEDIIHAQMESTAAQAKIYIGDWMRTTVQCLTDLGMRVVGAVTLIPQRIRHLYTNKVTVVPVLLGNQRRAVDSTVMAKKDQKDSPIQSGSVFRDQQRSPSGARVVSPLQKQEEAASHRKIRAPLGSSFRTRSAPSSIKGTPSSLQPRKRSVDFKSGDQVLVISPRPDTPSATIPHRTQRDLDVSIVSPSEGMMRHHDQTHSNHNSDIPDSIVRSRESMDSQSRLHEVRLEAQGSIDVPLEGAINPHMPPGRPAQGRMLVRDYMAECLEAQVLMERRQDAWEDLVDERNGVLDPFAAQKQEWDDLLSQIAAIPLPPSPASSPTLQQESVTSPKGAPKSRPGEHAVSKSKKTDTQASPTSSEEELQAAPLATLVSSLSQEWREKVMTVMQAKASVSVGKNVTAGDVQRLAPGVWLNDELVNEFIRLVVEEQLQLGKTAAATSGTPSPATLVPRLAQLNTAWYGTIRGAKTLQEGAKKLSRWLKRAKVGGKALLEVDCLFLPVMTGAHWTLVVISGRDRRVEHYNSMEGAGLRGPELVEAVMALLQAEVGQDEAAEFIFDLDGRSAQQNNGNDCGVFACFNALAVARGVEEPSLAFDACDMPAGRQLIAASLLNGSML